MLMMTNDMILKKLLRKILSKFGLFVYDNALQGLLHNLHLKYGYTNTIMKQKPLDVNDDPLPWFTYPAIEYLEQLDLSHKSIFEWGSGNSSLYFAKRCQSIVSIESDKNWYEYISQKLLPNQKVFLRNEFDFVNAIDELNMKYDVIIIDSLRRYECALKAIHYLNTGGLIILDNSDWHPGTSAFLRKVNDLIQVDMHGFGPINDYSWTTSLFFTRQFNFSPKDDIQPAFSKAAIHQVSKYDSPSEIL
jgi:hypothetical protein